MARRKSSFEGQETFGRRASFLMKQGYCATGSPSLEAFLVLDGPISIIWQATWYCSTWRTRKSGFGQLLRVFLQPLSSISRVSGPPNWVRANPSPTLSCVVAVQRAVGRRRGDRLGLIPGRISLGCCAATLRSEHRLRRSSRSNWPCCHAQLEATGQME